MNPYQYGTRAVKRVSCHKRHISLQNDQLVTGITGSNLEPGTGLHVLQPHPALNLRLHNIAVYLMAEVGMRPEQAGMVQQTGLCSLDALQRGWLQFDHPDYRVCPQ